MAACAAHGYEVTVSLYVRVRIPRRAIYEAKFLIAEYIDINFCIT